MAKTFLAFCCGFFPSLNFYFHYSSAYLIHSIPDMPVIALDLGGTKLAAALFDEEGEKIFDETVKLEKRKGKEVGELILLQVSSMVSLAEDNGLQVSSLGICVPGIAYASTGRVWAPNIPGWEDYPLRDDLKEELKNKKISISIDSDRACSILGEVWKGNAKGCTDAIFLAVGTGIGAGIWTNNQVLRGAYDIAGAIGWMALERPYDEKFRRCGCFEYNASGEGLIKVTREFTARDPLTQSLLNKPGEEITSGHIFDAYDGGDPLAVEVIGNAIECWGMAVANLVSLFNPQKIIFGGGVFGPALRFLGAINEEARKWAQPISIYQVKLEGAALGTQAGLYGAGYLALKA